MCSTKIQKEQKLLILIYFGGSYIHSLTFSELSNKMPKEPNLKNSIISA